MRELIQRGGIFFVAMIFALVIGVASAGDGSDDHGDRPMECYWKHETKELCYINESTGVEKCAKVTVEEWQCKLIDEPTP